jgi:oxidase EvaA
MVEWFLDADRALTVFDQLQSEEGTRYHGKYNQNVVRLVNGGADTEIPDNFRWYDLDALRHFCDTNNVLNTDSRSVLSCMDWGLLAGEIQPFSDHAPGTWGDMLRRSYEAVEQGCESKTEDLFAWLARLRVRCALRYEVLPIPELRNWVIERDRICEREREYGFMARQFRVTALRREVGGWDQPLIDSDGIGRIVLVTQERAGLVHFLVKASFEIGFLEGVQLSASMMTAPGALPDSGDPVATELLRRIDSADGAITLASCRQSEEGGRFYRDENDYAIVRLDTEVSLPESDFYRWLTLGQIRKMIEVPGAFSMELRGVLVLLFRWL